MRVARVLDSTGTAWIVVAQGDELIPVAEGSALAAIAAIKDKLSEPIGSPLRAADVRFLPPVDATSLRDFTSFRGHVETVYGGWGLAVPKEWYLRPSFYTGNTNAMSGHGDAVPAPDGCVELDYEAEIACVIGTECINIDPADPNALEVIAGFTILNDWSARDLQRRDSASGVGPGKGKDFANSLGPFLSSPDEISGFPHAPSGRVVVRVNDVEQSVCDMADMSWTWAALIAVASANARLVPGDVIAAGTCTGGCILEHRALGRDVDWLRPGDRVEVDAEGIGALSNTVAPSLGPSVVSIAGVIPGWRGDSEPSA